MASSGSAAGRLFQVILMAFMGLILVACGGGAGSGTVGLPTGTALATTAPSAITLSAGEKANYTISGGTPIYSVVSSGTAVVRVEASGTTLSVIATGAGTATVSIRDAASASLSISVTVTGTTTTIAPLFSSAPSAITLAPGANVQYTVSGGVPVYNVTSSNPAVATVGVRTNMVVINALAAGNANVVISDAAGSVVTIGVSVVFGGTATPLFTTAPSSVNIDTKSTVNTYKIGGGTGAYNASSNDTSVARASINGSTLSITGIAAGTAQVAVSDSAGTVVTIGVNAGNGAIITPATLFTTSPSGVTIAPGATSQFSISGGNLPYSVSSSNLSVANASIFGNRFIITGVAAGTAQVLVFDAAGASVAISVTVPGSGGGTIPLFSSAPSAIVIDTAGTPNAFSIGGGSAPYSVSSSNVGVATAALNGTTLTIRGVSNGAAQVVVVDASGTSLSIGITAGATPVPPAALYTTAPSALTIATGTGAAAFSIAGGVAPYRTSSSDTSVVTAAAAGASLSLDGIAPGTAQVLVFDAAGSIVTIAVTVQGTGGGATAPVISPASITVSDCTTNIPFVIAGGSAPFSVFTSDTSVPASAATRFGNSYIFTASVNALGAGSTFSGATITVLDSQGRPATATITTGGAYRNVCPNSAPLQTSPSTAVAPVAQTLTFQITGGTAPYTVATSNAAIATAAIATPTSTSLTITGVSAGDAVVSVISADGQRANITVTILP